MSSFVVNEVFLFPQNSHVATVMRAFELSDYVEVT